MSRTNYELDGGGKRYGVLIKENLKDEEVRENKRKNRDSE